MRILQVVPALPHQAGGVAAFAIALAGALAAEGVESRFAVGTPAGGEDECGGAGDFPAAAVGRRRGRELAALLGELGAGASPAGAAWRGGPSGEVVLLHYANYGYSRRGCPAWLLAGLRRWKSAASGRRLVTVFHELWASGPPWRSSFWLRPRQRRLALTVARLSDAGVTSLRRYAAALAPALAADRLLVRPVFSTVGEPPQLPPLAPRARRLVLFGGPGARRRAYGALLGDLEAACRTLAVEALDDIGGGLEAVPREVAGRPVTRHGFLAAAETSRLLTGVFAGFVAYPPAYLAKSTIYAAYAAHGLLPVCAWRHGEPREDRAAADARVPCWSPRHGGAPVGEEIERLAAAAHTCYAEHALAVQVRCYRRLLFTGTAA